MLPLLALFLLLGPSVCTTTGDREELTLGTEAESWVTVNLKGIPVASIELQLQETKRSRTRQFYGLMGKRVEGIRPNQPKERMGECCPGLPSACSLGWGTLCWPLATLELAVTLWLGACLAGTAVPLRTADVRTANPGYQLGRIMQELLGERGLSIEGTCRQETHHQGARPGAVTREDLQSQRGRPDSLNHQQHIALFLGTEEDGQGSE
ncbi:tachykinin-4 [Phodopus roborovskii]|uniref:tachykinin-4 n=1 Tax=Phodopus roborovskii TaxID=109678 RepID=UPI0021E3B03F|nr:tachykinin-4 [Phodopus roborovskii]